MTDSLKDWTTVWTDGACFPNPGKGGWGWTTLLGECGYGGADSTTNQVMELTAVIRAVRATWPRPIIIVSDSQYVIKGATEWSKKWVRNGWVNAQFKPVANRPVWEALLDEIKARAVQFKWVKGHSGDPGNEEADRLATLGSGASPELIDRCKNFYHGARA